ncbi:hypothetical protein BZG36_02415 [Bifiguratus adelaidae]|uniref:Dipeptidyl-peptidase V n=1 Tax=Bifiguratus adelaidae TaxID=1938954 RepID=A0A261Y1E8_9FUNG|nr:hypothetical protein BZG36_02415 [Bifiguratus adelaidae]
MSAEQEISGGFSPRDLVSLGRPGLVVTSPNGKYAAFTMSTYNEEENKSSRNLYLVDLQTSEIKALTEASFEIKQDSPLFLSDSAIAYFQNIPAKEGEEAGPSQVFVKDLRSTKDAYPITQVPVEIGNLKYNAKAKLLAFSAAVYEDGTLEGAKERDAEEKKRKDSALVYDELLFRHWDTFTLQKKQNIFVISLQEGSDGTWSTAGKEVNIMANLDLESPVLPFGDSEDFDIAPDGSEIAFVSKAPGNDKGWSTAQHIYLAKIKKSDGVIEVESTKPNAINDDIKAASSHPTYSQDGTKIAYLQMYVPQYEADRNRVILYDRSTGERQVLTDSWDRSPSSIAFAEDDSSIFVVAEDYGRSKIFQITLSNGNVVPLTEHHTASSVNVVPGQTLVFNMNSMTSPSDVFALDLSKTNVAPRRITDLHKDLKADLHLPEPEEFSFQGAKTTVHGWIIKPYHYEEGSTKKYPLAFLIHGGPQGNWGDSWSTRWNPSVFAGAGFAVVAINPTGSTGYGQAFTDAIRKNWGGAPYQDLMKGLDHVLETYDFIDKERVAGLGASYGGYMINWMNGQAGGRRFRCFVNHDGVFNTQNTFWATEELYFPEHEFGGTPFNPVARFIYEHWSPSNYVRRWKTPTLVVHGGKDYRLVDSEGFSTFTALRRQGVPARLVYFPDENHWVIQPANSLKWHKEVLEWITYWTSEDAPKAAQDSESDSEENISEGWEKVPGLDSDVFKDFTTDVKRLIMQGPM